MKNLFIYLSLILLPLNIVAQNELTGNIKDAKDSSIIVGATIYISDMKTGSSSGIDGSYSIKNLPEGHFLVEVRLTGYAPIIQEVEIDGVTTVNFRMTIANYEFNEVVITGVSSATERKSDPIPVNVVTQKDLLQNSATNLMDALSISPGLSTMTHGASIAKPFIRGLGYNRVITMNDGVRQEGQQWFDEFGEEIDEYSVYKAEILRGPASLSYGSDAMAGVINLLPFPTLPEGQIKGNILLNYQTNNGQLGESFNLGGNQKGFVWDIRYTNKMTHCYQNKYDGYVANSAFSESNFKAMIGVNRKWGYSHLTVSTFDLKLGIAEGIRDSATGKFLEHYIIKDNTGAFGDSLGIEPESDFKKYNYYPIIHQHISHTKAVLDNSFAIGENRLNVRIGFQQNNRREANDPGQGDFFNNHFFMNTINYDVRYILPERNHFEMSIGANGMQQNSKDLGTAFVLPEYSLFDIGAFAIAKKTMNKLTVSGGLRYDMRTLKGKGLYVDSTGQRVSGPGLGILNEFTAYTSNFSGLSGSVGASYDFTKSLYGKLNVSRGYRAPSAQESGANGIHDGTPFFEIGDHNLKAESSLEVDGTLGFNTNNITIEVTGFMNNINNFIFAEKLQSVFGGDSISVDLALPPDVGTGPTFKFVQGNAMLTGGEGILNIHPSQLKWIQFNNSFCMVNAVQKNQPDSTKYLPYTPPYKVRSELVFECPKSGKTFNNAYLKFGVDHFFEQNKIYYKFDNETLTPAYTLLSVGLGTDVCTKTRTVCSLYVYVSNLTDMAYQSNMNRMKYTDPNNVTGRIGIYNMGRNISFKLIIPIDVKK